MVSGKGLGVEGPGRARADAVETYMQMSGSSSWNIPYYHPISSRYGRDVIAHSRGP